VLNCVHMHLRTHTSTWARAQVQMSMYVSTCACAPRCRLWCCDVLLAHGIPHLWRAVRGGGGDYSPAKRKNSCLDNKARTCPIFLESVFLHTHTHTQTHTYTNTHTHTHARTHTLTHIYIHTKPVLFLFVLRRNPRSVLEAVWADLRIPVSIFQALKV